MVDFDNSLKESLLELIRKTSTDLPQDVKDVIYAAYENEEEGSNAKYAMGIIKEDIELAREKSGPICQDTGTIIIKVYHPEGFGQLRFIEAAKASVVEATTKGYLRQNSVDSITGKNTGNNLGAGHPSIFFKEHDKDEVIVKCMLKGGGCENVGIQSTLPNTELNAGRDLDGVRKMILNGVVKAQGKGCGPGILGVSIGGDRGSGYLDSKEQLFRKLTDTNPNEELAKLEKDIVDSANKLKIGPMGFGGATTLLGCKIGVLNRLPASYFVSVSYMCWAYRRQGITLTSDNNINEWLY